MTDQIHLVVATPCFGGQVSSIYASSIFQLQRAMQLKSNMRAQGSDARRRRVDHARARQSDDASSSTIPPRHISCSSMPISALSPSRCFRLIESGADVVAGVYPIKRVNWDKAKRVIETRRPKLPSAALDYVLEVDDPDHVAVVNGFTRVRYAGTGFLMVRRHVFEKMCAHPAYAIAAILSRAFAGYAGRKPQPLCLVRMHDRSGNRNLSQRGFCLLQTLDRYRRRDLGRSREPPRSCRPCGIPRRYLVAVRRRRADDRCGVRCRPVRRLACPGRVAQTASAWRGSQKWRSPGSIFARCGKN